jgi:hypothetical protein
VLFSKAILECWEEIWIEAKWKYELEWSIFFNVIKKFNVAIWSCMKLEDVLKVLPLLMLKKFLDQFIFIWGCE